MLKHISVILVLCFLVLACHGPNRPKKPDNLISKAQMSDLLYDLYLINAAKGVNRKTLETNGFDPENYILDKYNIDSIQFADSNAYYTFDSETYNEIVETVKARLQENKKEFDLIKEKNSDSIKKRQDSIRNLRIKTKDKIKTKKRLDTVGSSKRPTPRGRLEIADSLR
ncbi:DUF4296 domain-containing protein [Winogradskyella vidalii]|uniref:DUF4296 domain-containing protein n=1 Tax=Winogradskyella vidalii TaxID=2615024 RepID=UPI0015C7BC31|nr:DUF4296 domain-containing protein [Winogradskyella vidalii]